MRLVTGEVSFNVIFFDQTQSPFHLWNRAFASMSNLIKILPKLLCCHFVHFNCLSLPICIPMCVSFFLYLPLCPWHYAYCLCLSIWLFVTTPLLPFSFSITFLFLTLFLLSLFFHYIYLSYCFPVYFYYIATYYSPWHIFLYLPYISRLLIAFLPFFKDFSLCCVFIDRCIFMAASMNFIWAWILKFLMLLCSENLNLSDPLKIQFKLGLCLILGPDIGSKKLKSQ